MLSQATTCVVTQLHRLVDSRPGDKICVLHCAEVAGSTSVPGAVELLSVRTLSLGSFGRYEKRWIFLYTLRTWPVSSSITWAL